MNSSEQRTSIARVAEISTRIENERVVLRRYTHFDAGALLKLIQENASRLENDFPTRVRATRTERDAERFIEQKYLEWERGESLTFGIWVKATGSYVGEIALKEFAPEIRSADLGYFLDRQFERRGLMRVSTQLVVSLAFDALHLNKLQVRCSSANGRSQRVAVRAGFMLEGIVRDTFLCADGVTLLDMYYYGMTAEDFRKAARE
jgi:RimJ/RimL family protein N-acetyltransferase